GGNDGSISIEGLTASSTYDLTYNDGTSNVGPQSITTNASGSYVLGAITAGSYSSFVIDDGNCSFTVAPSLSLTDPSAPVFASNSVASPSICGGSDGEISLTGLVSNTTYDLTYLDDGVSVGPTSITTDASGIILLTGLNSGNYSSFVLDLSGCTGSTPGSITLTDPSSPVLQITDPSAVCSPGTVDISASDVTVGSTGGGTLTYWTDAAATAPLADASSVVVSGMYYIQSESNGCTDIEAVNVLVNETPSFTVSGTDPSVCNAADGLITINGLESSTDYTLSYDSLATTSQTATITTDATGEFILNGFEAGIYEAFSITLNGCAFTATESIDLNNPSAPSIALQLDTVVCDTYSLGEITGDNLSGNEAYYSQANGAGVSLNAGDIIAASQTVYIYDIIGACSDEASFTLTVNNTPELTNLTTQEVCVSFELPLTIDGTNLSGNQNYYDAAQADGGTLLTGPITTSQQVYLYDANGTCSDEVFFEVTINALPEVLSFSGEATYCEGETIESLTATLSGSGALTLEYTIDGASTSATTNTASIDLGTAPGVYVLTQITDENCNNTSNLTQTITINALPTVPNTSADASYCANAQPDAIQADGSTGDYTWYADQDLTEVLGNQDTYTPQTILGTTSYYVTATENGCEGPAQMVLVAFEECGVIIPTAFTPDGDQTNDTWTIKDIDAIYPNHVVSVYNRLGNKVYESIKGGYNQMPWDGTFNGESLPVASYYFIIEYNDNSTPNSNGIVSIIK
ncbi:gliding motility-associated C-terminal domain-containing protein, partial [Crocinitomicaceae bacterium]|nr:gliding motility-associated C-terminal domain-containing protein [Crocinitomicaceae bacterium]